MSFYIRNKEREKKDADELIAAIPKETIHIWTEDFKPDKYTVTFDADHYVDWMNQILPEPMVLLPKNERIKLGDKEFCYQKMPLTYFAQRAIGPCVINIGVRRSQISMGPRYGDCRFTKPVYIPQIVSKMDVWMSLTPFEILTQRPGLKKARGNVLVGGLGMAWFARRCCERKQVTRVTVFDTDPAVIEHFKFKHPKLDAIVCDDVWTARHDAFDSVLLDIWSSYGSAEGQPNLLKLKAVHRNVWAWGDVQCCWQKGLW